MPTLTLRAPAKVNLFLDVLGKRPDNYHDIRSLIVPVSLYDTIHLETTSTPRIQLKTRATLCFPGIPWSFKMATGSANLAVAAAHLLQKATGCTRGATITLIKRIPVTSGLGGGSSDAAAVLLGLNALWRTKLSTAHLLELAASAGCDVPALLLGRPVLVGGRGEQVQALALPATVKPLHMLLVNPGLSISTADIYSRFAKNKTFGSTDNHVNGIVRGLCLGAVSETAANLYNALEETVFEKYPLLTIVKERLIEAGAKGVVLSGSGATMLAITRDRAHARLLATRIPAALNCPIWAVPAAMLPDAWPKKVTGCDTARWCNGSTRPFGGQSLGSNPSRASAGCMRVEIRK